MSAFYDELAALAHDLIDEFGQDVELLPPPPVTDPVTGAVPPGDPPGSTNTRGIMRTYPQNLVDETRILRSDRLLVLSHEVEPVVSGRAKVNGENWTIEDVRTASPAGVPLVYFAQVRR